MMRRKSKPRMVGETKAAKRKKQVKCNYIIKHEWAVQGGGGGLETNSFRKRMRYACDMAKGSKKREFWDNIKIRLSKRKIPREKSNWTRTFIQRKMYRICLGCVCLWFSVNRFNSHRIGYTSFGMIHMWGGYVPVCVWVCACADVCLCGK